MDSSFRTLGVLLFPQFETLDVFGPLEMFGMLPEQIKIVMISAHGGLVQSAQGQWIHTDSNWQDTPKLDLLLVPGGYVVNKEADRDPFKS